MVSSCPPPQPPFLAEPLEDNYTKGSERRMSCGGLSMSLHPTGKSKCPPGRVVKVWDSSSLLVADGNVPFRKLIVLALAI